MFKAIRKFLGLGPSLEDRIKEALKDTKSEPLTEDQKRKLLIAAAVA